MLTTHGILTLSDMKIEFNENDLTIVGLCITVCLLIIVSFKGCELDYNNNKRFGVANKTEEVKSTK